MSALEVTSGDVQQMLTDKQIPCPQCGVPMIGARCMAPQESRTPFIGLVCRPCDGVYHYGKDA